MAQLEKLHELCGKTYKEQAVWFLNCFWEQFAEKEAERVWAYVLKNEELDLENHKAGAGLDEMKAHVFLEKFDETLTVRDMRDKLRATGAIGQTERPKLVPLTHYLLYKYNADWRTLVDESRQGDNKEEMEKAEQLLAEVQAAFQESEQKASEARLALIEAQKTEAAAVSRENEAKAREAEAKASEAEAKAREADARSTEAEAVQRENEAREAEAPFKAAQEEVSSALAEVHKQEAEYHGKIADCERRSSEGGVVQQNKAKAELAQLRAEDPLPLRKAKITLEAAEKRAAKARAPFEAATKVASDARAAASQAADKASQARKSAEQDAQAASRARESASQARQAAANAAQASAAAKDAAEAALNAAAARLEEAEAYLREVRSRPGVSFGSLWWIDRELLEQRKYLPTSKGGIAK
jgi:DNA polymerase III gamma/tau subunit